jgi:molecular chaperone DnaK
VTIVVLQGERKMAKDNKEIGRFDLADIPPSPRGVPQIEVAFDIDADGLLHVSAKDKATGKEQRIKIEARSGLNEDEIKRMLRDAEEHAEEDKKRKEEAEIRNLADSEVFRAEKALKEFHDKLPKEVVSDVQSKIDAVKKALESNDMARIRVAKEELEEHMMKIGESLKGAGASGGGEQPQHAEQPSAEQPKSKNDDIEEAEVEIIEDDKQQ